MEGSLNAYTVRIALGNKRNQNDNDVKPIPPIINIGFSGNSAKPPQKDLNNKNGQARLLNPIDGRRNVRQFHPNQKSIDQDNGNDKIRELL